MANGFTDVLMRMTLGVFTIFSCLIIIFATDITWYYKGLWSSGEVILVIYLLYPVYAYIKKIKREEEDEEMKIKLRQKAWGK